MKKFRLDSVVDLHVLLRPHVCRVLGRETWQNYIYCRCQNWTYMNFWYSSNGPTVMGPKHPNQKTDSGFFLVLPSSIDPISIYRMARNAAQAMCVWDKMTTWNEE